MVQKENTLAQLEVLKEVKDFLTSKLQESQTKLKNLEYMLEDAQATLKYEKNNQVKLKLQSKIYILQNQQSIFQNYKDKLQKKIVIIIMEDNEKLLGHKKVFIEEVYRLRELG